MKNRNQQQLRKQQAKARRLRGYEERLEFLKTNGCLDGSYSPRFKDGQELGEGVGLPPNQELRDYEFQSIMNDALVLADLSSAYARRGLRIDEVKTLLDRGCRIVSRHEFKTIIDPMGIVHVGEHIRRAIAPGVQVVPLSLDDELQLQESMERLMCDLIPVQRAMFIRNEIEDESDLDNKPAAQRHWGI